MSTKARREPRDHGIFTRDVTKALQVNKARTKPCGLADLLVEIPNMTAFGAK
jgi:hypothetical protein